MENKNNIYLAIFLLVAIVFGGAFLVFKENTEKVDKSMEKQSQQESEDILAKINEKESNTKEEFPLQTETEKIESKSNIILDTLHTEKARTTNTAMDNWVGVGNAGFSAGAIGGYNITSSSNTFVFNPSTNEPYVAFIDEANSSKATVMKYNGLKWIVVGSAGFSPKTIADISIAFSPLTNEPYVSYSYSYKSGSQKASVMRFNGSRWVFVGNAEFSDSVSNSINIAFNPSTNEPYVVYMDLLRTTVKKFNGVDWLDVGSARFSSGNASFTTIAFNPSTNEPYIAFKDVSAGSGVTVMRFDGKNWIIVGQPSFSTNDADGPSMSFNPLTNEPYVIFKEFSVGNDKVAVMKFDGTNWSYVGTPFEKEGNHLGLSNLSFSPSTNEMYLAYNHKGLIVKKFNGVNWEIVGNNNMRKGLTPRIAFNPETKEPYVFYLDISVSNKATVMKLDSLIP